MAGYSCNTVAGLDIDTQSIENLYALGSVSVGVPFTVKNPHVTFGGANDGLALTFAFVACPIIAECVGAVQSAIEQAPTIPASPCCI